MAHCTSALSFLLVLVLVFSLVNIEARESKFFAKAVVTHPNNTTDNVTHHVEPPSPWPSPAPVEAQINTGYGLYGRDDEIPGDSLFENKIPTQEFNEKFGKEDAFDNNDLPSNYNERPYVTVPREGANKDKSDDKEFISNNGLPSNYNERSYVTVPQEGDNKDKFDDKEFSNNGLPSNYNERSYVTVPQEGDNKEKIDNDEFMSNNGLPSNYNERSYVTVPQGTNSYDTKFTSYENEFASNDQEKLTPEEEKLFDEDRKENSYDPQKLSHTPKFAETDNYFNDNRNHNTYNSVKEPQGMSDTRTLEDGKYHYALSGDGRRSLPKYNSQGYYAGDNGKPKSKYEFDTMEEFERQEGYSQVPGEYVNP